MKDGIRLSEKILLLFLCITIIYPGWFYNNAALDFPEPLPYLATLLLSLLIFSPLFDRGGIGFAPVRSRLVSLVKDPFFYLGLLCIIYVSIQYLNTGAVRLWDSTVDVNVRFTPTRLTFLPFSVDEIFARRMVLWSFTAWSIILSLRHGISKKGQRFVFAVMLMNGIVLAVVGLAQYFSGTGKILWIFSPDKGDYFYSTFGYENFGGAFFTLIFAVACGCLIDSIMQVRKERVGAFIKGSLAIASMPVLALSIFLTNTRFCYLELFFLLLIFTIALFLLFLRQVGRKQAMVALVFLSLVFSGIVWIAFTSDHKGSQDLRNMATNGRSFIDREFRARTWQWEAAVKVWRDYPLFGTGHDNIRYLQQRYLPKNWKRVGLSKGKANTHNDFLQYLSEFGIVGMTLFMMAIFYLLAQGLNYRFWKNPLLLWGFIGMGLNVVHSLIDLPYRNCLIVLNSAAILAIISCYQREVKEEEPQVQVPGRSFMAVTLVGLVLMVVYLISGLFLPLKLNKAEALADEALKVEDLEEKVALLEKAECAHPRLDKVRIPLAESLFKLSTETNDPVSLKKAGFYIQQSYLRDHENHELALSFARIMEKNGYKWEALNSLLLLYKKFPDSEEAFSNLKFFYLRHGYRRKAIELMKNKKK